MKSWFVRMFFAGLVFAGRPRLQASSGKAATKSRQHSINPAAADAGRGSRELLQELKRDRGTGTK